jgi:hypothetical protein
MKVKEESALRKVFNVRKRVTDAEKIRKASSELKQIQQIVKTLLIAGTTKRSRVTREEERV